MPKILLSYIVEALEMQDQLSSHYYHIPTGEIVFIGDHDFMHEEADDDPDAYADWELESIEKAKDIIGNDDYVELPTSFDINEYSMMERFCFTIHDDIGNILYDSIQGSGAFGRFKNIIQRYGIENRWYKYRENLYYEIAKEWCEENEIPFHDDREK
jgi:hypothetical protein